ncbi:MAG: GspE/PulE family protein [Gammaproteobacteria bacterium]
MTQLQKIRIGDLLLQSGAIDAARLESALAEQKKSGRKLGRVLVDAGYVAEDELLRLLSHQLGIEVVDLGGYAFDPAVVRLVPEAQARRFRAVALRATVDGVLVALADPTNAFACDELAALLNRPILLAVAREADILRSLDHLYVENAPTSPSPDDAAVDLQADATPGARRLESLLRAALDAGAVTVHLEHGDGTARIRLRTAHGLRDLPRAETAVEIVGALRRLCGLETKDQSRPRRGGCRVRLGDRRLALSISTLPAGRGESVAVGIRTEARSTLDDLGMEPRTVRDLRALLAREAGVLILAAADGHGRNTTLHAAIAALDHDRRRVVVVQGWHGHTLPGAEQVAAGEDADIGVMQAIRAVQRQGVDVLAVEEADDWAATALLRRVAGSALVLCACSVAGLRDGVRSFAGEGGIDPAVLTQRLLPAICPHCRSVATPDAGQRARLRSLGAAEGGYYLRGPGCDRCQGTGAAGRVAVFGLLDRAAAQTDPLEPLRAAAAGAAAAGRVALADALSSDQDLA